MLTKRHTLAIALAGMLACLAWPSFASAQTAPGNESTELKYPRNMVRGGALGQRKPGNWTNTAKGKHLEFQDRAFNQFGGGTPISEDQVPPPRRQVIQVAFFEQLFATLTDLVEQLKTAIQLSQVAAVATQ